MNAQVLNKLKEKAKDAVSKVAPSTPSTPSVSKAPVCNFCGHAHTSSYKGTTCSACGKSFFEFPKSESKMNNDEYATCESVKALKAGEIVDHNGTKFIRLSDDDNFENRIAAYQCEYDENSPLEVLLNNYYYCKGYMFCRIMNKPYSIIDDRTIPYRLAAANYSMCGEYAQIYNVLKKVAPDCVAVKNHFEMTADYLVEARLEKATNRSIVDSLKKCDCVETQLLLLNYLKEKRSKEWQSTTTFIDQSDPFNPYKEKKIMTFDNVPEDEKYLADLVASIPEEYFEPYGTKETFWITYSDFEKANEPAAGASDEELEKRKIEQVERDIAAVLAKASKPIDMPVIKSVPEAEKKLVLEGAKKAGVYPADLSVKDYIASKYSIIKVNGGMIMGSIKEEDCLFVVMDGSWDKYIKSVVSVSDDWSYIDGVKNEGTFFEYRYKSYRSKVAIILLEKDGKKYTANCIFHQKTHDEGKTWEPMCFERMTDIIHPVK
ncbi:MAG: hypothetical protein HUK15_01470 [Bacteroidales bacterium]|nr:hypothetical protein [Bacteroidales bacterium]